MPNNNLSVSFILRSAAHRCDMLVGEDGGDPGDVELSTFILPQSATVDFNLEVATLWDVLVSTHEDYCIRHLTITTRADQEDYPLPRDFYKFRKLFPVVSGKRAAPLRKFNLEDLGDSNSRVPVMTSQIEDTQYRVSGNRLWLHPTPSSADELELWYIPQAPLVINLEDKPDFRFPFGWEEYIIEGLAARWMEKEESDSGPFRARQQQVLQRLLTMVEDRDTGEPFSMIDTEGYLTRGGWH